MLARNTNACFCIPLKLFVFNGQVFITILAQSFVIACIISHLSIPRVRGIDFTERKLLSYSVDGFFKVVDRVIYIYRTYGCPL